MNQKFRNSRKMHILVSNITSLIQQTCLVVFVLLILLAVLRGMASPLTLVLFFVLGIVCVAFLEKRRVEKIFREMPDSTHPQWGNTDSVSEQKYPRLAKRRRMANLLSILDPYSRPNMQNSPRPDYIKHP
jgi:hypothetical protein